MMAIQRPWYRRGGMEINQIGMAINIALPLIVLASHLPYDNANGDDDDKMAAAAGQNHTLTSASSLSFPFSLTCSLTIKNFVSLLLLSYSAAILLSRRTSLYCIVVVPSFMASLCLVASLPTHDNDIQEMASVLFVSLSVSLVLAIAKVNICMSLCYHRYAAHAAFKCGPITHVCLMLLGCLANQGGPIWWASQHRLHHKHCDDERDPHSPAISGPEDAFGFFKVHSAVVEEFAPAHLESTFMRIIDTWSWVMVGVEMVVSYWCFGRTGLFIAYTSSWLCQTITLWFNIANHPPAKEEEASQPQQQQETKTTTTTTGGGGTKKKAVCLATDGGRRGAATISTTTTTTINNGYFDPWKDDPSGVYLPFVFLNSLVPLFAFFVKELEHEHHHNHPMLAKRSKYDIAYWSFVYPLEQMGLVWNVIVPKEN
jgi:fatty-acid desaturase